jgi:hypothetical protein
VIIPTTAGRAISILHQALLTDLRPPERTFTTPESFPPVAQLSSGAESTQLKTTQPKTTQPR